MRKTIFVLVAVLMMVGCVEQPQRWDMRRECITPDSKTRAAELTKVFLAATPKSIGGDDQDWEDAINAAAARAQEIECPLIMVEVTGNHRETGRWKNISQVQVK